VAACIKYQNEQKMSDYVKKSVLLTGTLKNDLVYKPYPQDELNHFSFLSVNSVSYSTSENFTEVFTISCNVVKGPKYSNNYEIITGQYPLATFLLKGQPNSTNCVRFNLNWFPITSLSDQLKFTFENFVQERSTKTCDVRLVVFLK